MSQAQDLLPLVATLANAVFTALRIVANIPQLAAVARDMNGARAISVPSWLMFTCANGSNGLYAIVVGGDVLLFVIGCASACSSLAIAVLAWRKQRAARLEATGPANDQATARAIVNAAAAASPPMVNV